MLITDGVDYNECTQLQSGFGDEGAKVMLTTPHAFLTIETVEGHKRGPDLTIDIDMDMVEREGFDGLIIPHGVLSTGMLKEDARVLQLITNFYREVKPIFASGNSVELLYNCHILPRQVVVRDSDTISAFVEKAVGFMEDKEPPKPVDRGIYYKYRPTM